MNCQEYRNLIEDTLDVSLHGEPERRVRLHIEHCAACRSYFQSRRNEHIAFFSKINASCADLRLPDGFADRLEASVRARQSVRRGWRRLLSPRHALIAASLGVMAGFVLANVKLIMESVGFASGGEADGQEEAMATEGAEATTVEVVDGAAIDPNVYSVASVPSIPSSNNQSSPSYSQSSTSNSQSENNQGKTEMNTGNKVVAVLTAALAALTSSADTYTWTGAASATWNKTDANWDKGVWVDGSVAKFPDGVSVKDIVLGEDITAGGIQIASGSWSFGGAHTLTLGISGSGNVTLSQTSSASLTLKNGITVYSTSPCENNLNELNIENATYQTATTTTGKNEGRFHNGWNNGNGLTGGATINVRDGGVLAVYDFVPSPSQSAADIGKYRVNVTTGGVFKLDHVIQQYNLDTTRYSTLYFSGGTLEGFPGASGRQFDRLSKTQVRLGPGGLHIAGDNNIYLRTEIVSDNGTDGGIFIDTIKMVYLYAGNTGLPENTFTGPVRFTEMGSLLIVNGDRNFGAVPDEPTDGIIFDTTYGRLLAEGHDTRLDPNRNILIQSNAVVVLAANGCSLAVGGTISGNAPGSTRNGTLNTDWPVVWTGTLSLLPPAGRTNSIGRLIVKTHDLTIGGEGVTEITDTLDNIGLSGDDGVFSVMNATLNVTNGLVRVMTNNYSIVENGNLNVSGGTLDLSRQLLLANANNGTSTTTVSRAGTLIANQYCPSLRQSVPELGLTRLQTGGTFMLNSFFMPIDGGKLTSRAQIDFDGGVLAPLTASRTFFDSSSVTLQEWNTNTLCMVREGGAVISNDVEIWTHHPFLSGAAQDGGLHKWGTAKLALITTENTFNGPIEVHQGQLIWGNANNYLSTSRLVTHDGGIADVNNFAQTLARVEGNGVVKQCNNLTVTGAVAPGFGAAVPGTLNFWHRCTFDDCAFEIDAGDKLTIYENQDISGLTLYVNDVSALDQETVYTIIEGRDGADFTGTFKGDNIQNCSNWRIRYVHANREVLLKYVRGTTIVIR